MRALRLPLCVVGTGVGLAGLATLVVVKTFRDAIDWYTNGR